jgi:hypothetical protein
MMLTVTITSEHRLTGTTARGKLNLVDPHPHLPPFALSSITLGDLRWIWLDLRESTSLEPQAKLSKKLRTLTSP